MRRLLDVFATALTSLGEHKLRTALTMLGMMFGVGAVIAMLSIGAGAKHQALALIEEVGGDNVFLQYDIYHAQRTEGELAETLRRHVRRIGHVQIADNPGRNEPGTGEINYPFLFRNLDEIGYEGWGTIEAPGPISLAEQNRRFDLIVAGE